ncbi:hypothetical protein CEXT_651221 [Caerostris extrusa]|uniref:Uncharacterized protein n=1 Tax=Caerostris extrusa TaxID=172846 RepID=A0AAV4Y5C8_CAEEX|nr:hypothetical protein CEXT_651221 [Caerostris extrusa]
MEAIFFTRINPSCFPGFLPKSPQNDATEVTKESTDLATDMVRVRLWRERQNNPKEQNDELNVQKKEHPQWKRDRPPPLTPYERLKRYRERKKQQKNCKVKAFYPKQTRLSSSMIYHQMMKQKSPLKISGQETISPPPRGNSFVVERFWNVYAKRFSAELLRERKPDITIWFLYYVLSRKILVLPFWNQ